MSRNGAGGSALRQRAAAAAQRTGGGAGNGAGAEVARREDAAVTPLWARIEKLEEEFAKAMPTGVAVQFVRDAVTCLRTIRDLDRCEPMSVLGALMSSASLGLRPGLLGHSWPLPYWDSQLEFWDPVRERQVKGGHRAQLIIGYQGYNHLGYESDRVASIRAARVHEVDEFEFDEGSGLPPLHRRPKLGTDRGPVIGYYAVVTTVTGGTIPWVMDVPEIKAHRDRYAPRKKEYVDGKATGRLVIAGPWAQPVGSREFDAMAQKTCLRYAFKTAPKSAQLARAVGVDGSVRVNVDPAAEPETVSQHPVQEPIDGQVVPDGEYDPTGERGFGRENFRG